MKSLVVFLSANYYYSGKIKEDEKSGVCSTDGKDKRYVRGIGSENPNGTDHVEE
jgi:hypothetical protein